MKYIYISPAALRHETNLLVIRRRFEQCQLVQHVLRVNEIERNVSVYGWECVLDFISATEHTEQSNSVAYKFIKMLCILSLTFLVWTHAVHRIYISQVEPAGTHLPPVLPEHRISITHINSSHKIKVFLVNQFHFSFVQIKIYLFSVETLISFNSSDKVEFGSLLVGYIRWERERERVGYVCVCIVMSNLTMSTPNVELSLAQCCGCVTLVHVYVCVCSWWENLN